MDRRLVLRKWSEEASVTAKLAEVVKSAAPSRRAVLPTLVHDDGRFRIYKSGNYFFVAGEVTDTQPTLRKTEQGWEALVPQLQSLADQLNKEYPHDLPGKSSSARTRVMREMVTRTPKGFGLGDSAVWQGLKAQKDFDFEAKHPRDGDGKFTDAPDTAGPVARPGSGPDALEGSRKLVDWQTKLLEGSEPVELADRTRYKFARLKELKERYTNDPGFQKLVAEEQARSAEEEELYGLAPDTREPDKVEQDVLEKIRGAWFVDVAATPTTGAMQRLVAEEFGLEKPYNGVPSYMQAQVDQMIGSHGDFLRRVIKDTYADTQALLKAQGVGVVEVWRGLRGQVGIPVGHHADLEYDSLALTSWSTKKEVADRFVRTPGAILKALVPAANIFSIGNHGMIGEGGEYEAVLIGNKLKGEAWAWTAQTGQPPEGVAKMTNMTINPDENPENSNWLHPKASPSLAEKVRKAVTDPQFEDKHPRDESGQFAPKDSSDLPPSLSNLSIPGLNAPARSAADAGSAQTPVQTPLPLPAGSGTPAAPVAPKKRVITPEEMRPPKYPVVPFGANLGKKVMPNGTVFSVDEGDLLGAPVEAIVNPANADLQHGGGVAGAIRTKGGYIIQVMSNNWVKKNGKITPKRAAVTAAGSLPQRAIVHAVAPIYGGGKFNEMTEMTNAYLSALKSAHVNNFKSIAFPSLGTGIFGNPLSLGTAAALKAVQAFDEHFPNSPLKEIHIVVRPQDTDTHEAFGNMINDRLVVDKPKPPEVVATTWTRDHKPSKPKAPPPTYTEPLIDATVSDEIMAVADAMDASGDKPLAMKISDVEAALFRGDQKEASSVFNALPREVREAFPSKVKSLLNPATSGGSWYSNLAQRVWNGLKGKPNA